MKLSQLIGEIGSNAAIDTAASGRDPQISGIFYRAQQVTAGGLFVAIKGLAADGHDFIDQAVARGAAAVVAVKPVAAKVPVVRVADTRQTLAELAAAFYRHPSRQMTVIGLTGTNGKTTASYLIEAILAAAGRRPGVIGTINYRYAGRTFDNPVTTPESLDLQAMMADMAAAGTDTVVMEVSSHALDMNRVHACRFDVGVLTNVTQDHLDYHGTMAAYWGCKQRLFTCHLAESGSRLKYRAVINIDDRRGRELAAVLKLPHLTTGHHQTAAVRAQKTDYSLDGIRAQVAIPGGRLAIESSLTGRHNLENLLNAVGVGLALQIEPAVIARGLASVTRVPGRLEKVPDAAGRYVYVDYAHTPDALENALKALADLTAGRLICVFGCGGDRDRDKRPKMGAVAARISDLAIVTSDNPRTEPPERIIEEILAGVQPLGGQRYDTNELTPAANLSGYAVQADRRRAIALGIGAARPGDTVLIAGKGHEPYQIVGTEKRPFDDREQARKALNNPLAEERA